MRGARATSKRSYLQTRCSAKRLLPLPLLQSEQTCSDRDTGTIEALSPCRRFLRLQIAALRSPELKYRALRLPTFRQLSPSPHLLRIMGRSHRPLAVRAATLPSLLRAWMKRKRILTGKRMKSKSLKRARWLQACCAKLQLPRCLPHLQHHRTSCKARSLAKSRKDMASHDQARWRSEDFSQPHPRSNSAAR